MIKTSTILVLGAGASKPYGFPLGSELRQSICAGAFPGSSSICEQLAAIDNEVSASEVKQFARRFLESGIDSIDSFLDRWPAHDELGRKIIAYSLIQKEHRNSVFNPNNSDDWYRRLWNNLVSDTQNASDLAFNKLKVLTFNYDRSLEHFFHSATKNTYRLNDSAAHEAWGKIPILHTYGLLGGYSYDSNKPPNRVFESDLTNDHLRIAAANLKIIQQTRSEDEVFQTARQWFDEAEEIYFLGFGFDPLNCERLDLPSVLLARKKQSKAIPRIYATVFGMTAPEVRNALLRTNPTTEEWSTQAATVLSAIRHWPLGAN